MGDESSPTASLTSPTVNQQNTHDLLADIFGSSNMPISQPASQPAKTTSTTDDILGLFGTTGAGTGTGSGGPSSIVSPVSPPPLAVSPGASSLFDAAVATPPIVASPPPTTTSPTPAQAHIAYDANGLQLSLTPRKDPSKPGLVDVLAKFTATTHVSGINFQAAVPKVRLTYRE
jgi:AP-1 complex subunit gamma-1